MTVMKTTFLISIASLSATTLIPLKAEESVNSKPNVIFILADDMGIGDLGCYGQTMIKTPNIDKLASNGLLFENHYSGSTVSAPSRCCLLTGKHTGHAFVRGNKGVEVNGKSFDLNIPDEEVTVAEIFKENGYSTMCVGKWGLGGPGTSGSPINQGFDYFFGYLSQGAAHRYYPETLFENDEEINIGGNVYSHFLIMQKGLEFIKENYKKPFFAYFAVTPPHADLDYPDLSQYSGKFEEKPFVNKSGKGFKTQMEPRAAYASMVSEVDKNVGQIISLLKELGILENTIVIFSSDNGVHHVGGHDPDFFDSNGPYRGYKRDLYEGGIHTPLIISWPQIIKKPARTSHVSAFWDFMPTVCDLLNVGYPKDIDGISYLPTIYGKNEEQKKHDYLYYEFYEQGGKQSITMADGWKLIRLNMNNPAAIKEELYNIIDDVDESDNVIMDHRDKASQLRNLMLKARTESPIFKWNNQK